jgi:hypothetical protein
MWRKVKFWTVTSVIVALSAACAYLYYFGRREAVVRRVIDAPAVVKEIQRISELATVKYSIQKVVGLEEEKVPFGSEKILLMVQATVLGGIDLSGFNTQDCVVAGNVVKIKLPPPRVLQVFINEKDTQVWDRSKTWWTPWVPFNPELERKARLVALEAVQAAALQTGILSNAQQNAEIMIGKFLNVAGFETIGFETAPADSMLREK